MRNATTFLLLLILAACAPMTGSATGLEGTRWMMPDSPVTLTFEEGHATGTGGCNQYRATYTVSGSALTLGPAISTKRACVEEAGNARETAYFAALGNVASYSVSGDRLTLSNAAGEPVLTFTRQP
jgi:heat shock protein HslJ